jgi:hypothetical protein
MDYTAITVAVVMTAGTIITQIALAFRSNNVIIFRLDTLEKKQDKHNNLIERMCNVEARAKSNSHRLDDLEKRKEAADNDD